MEMQYLDESAWVLLPMASLPLHSDRLPRRACTDKVCLILHYICNDNGYAGGVACSWS